MTSEPTKPVQSQTPAKPPMLSMPKWLLVGCGLLSAFFLVFLLGLGAIAYWTNCTEEGKKYAAQCEKERKLACERYDKRRAEEQAAKAQRDKEEAQHWVQEKNLERMNRKYGNQSPEDIARQLVIPNE